MSKLTVSGWGSNVIVYQISRQTADILAFRGISEDRFDELFGVGGTEDPIFDETALTDFELNFCLDGTQISIQPSIDTKELDSEPVIEQTGCYLVVEYSLKGTWLSLDINSEFDKDRLEISFEKYLLPSGSEVCFKHISYDGETNFGHTWGKGVDLIVVYPDQSCYGVKFRDEYDEDS
jgi:hypothetical protein